MHTITATLVRRDAVTERHHLLVLSAPEIAAAARPGQFVHLRVTDATDPLLRRPFSIMLANPASGEIQLLVHVIGRGTQILAQVGPGATFDLIGPLGNGWPLLGAAERPLLVAGGIGVAPLIFLAEALQEQPGDCYVRGLLGARSEDLLPCWLELSARCEEFSAATEDGSIGQRGLVTDLLPGQLARGDVDVIYSCGRTAMMQIVAAQAREAGVRCHVSMEQWMGCGVGVCLGCVVPTTGTGSERYRRACKDGPVFDAAEIAWEDAGNER